MSVPKISLTPELIKAVDEYKAMISANPLYGVRSEIFHRLSNAVPGEMVTKENSPLAYKLWGLMVQMSDEEMLTIALPAIEGKTLAEAFISEFVNTGEFKRWEHGPAN